MKSADGWIQNSRTAPSEILRTEDVDVVIDFLLAAEPSPYVMAFAENGLAVPLPEAVPVAAEHVVVGPTTTLELCVPSDSPTIIEAWHLTIETRAAHATVHLNDAPGRPVVLHFLDARHRYGVILALFVGSDGIRGDGPPAELFRRRACRMERNERALILSVDAAFTEVLGWKSEEIVGRQTMDIIHPDDKPFGIARWMEMLNRPGCDQRLMLRLAHRDGAYRWIEVSNRNLLSDPDRGRIVTDLVDVSDRMEALEALRASEELLQRLAQALPVGVAQIDVDRRIVYRNDMLSEILGIADAVHVDAQFALVAVADRRTFASALEAVLVRGTPTEVEVTIDVPSRTRRCSFALRALRGKDGAIAGAIVCVTDVTERARLSAEIERRAKFDDLTLCHNRASILSELEAKLPAEEHSGVSVAVIFIDLNRFKEINDRHGHAAGDRVLQQSAARIVASVRDNDLVGRIGGDEFLIVCPDVAPTEAQRIARRVATALAEPMEVGGISMLPGSSIGVAWTNAPDECDAFVAKADEAMYAAKRSGGGPILAIAP